VPEKITEAITHSQLKQKSEGRNNYVILHDTASGDIFVGQIGHVAIGCESIHLKLLWSIPCTEGRGGRLIPIPSADRTEDKRVKQDVEILIEDECIMKISDDPLILTAGGMIIKISQGIDGIFRIADRICQEYFPPQTSS